MKTFVVLLLIVFADGEPAGGKVGGPFDSMAACEAAKVVALERAKENDIDAALKCVEIKYKKPVVLKRERDL